MTIKRVDPGARMSEAVVHGDTVYLSGQVGEGDSVTEQTKDTLEAIDRILSKVGSDKSKLLSATIWLASMEDFEEMNAVWDSWIDLDNPPARACGESKLATPDFLVEVTVIAALE